VLWPATCRARGIEALRALRLMTRGRERRRCDPVRGPTAEARANVSKLAPMRSWRSRSRRRGCWTNAEGFAPRNRRGAALGACARFTPGQPQRGRSADSHHTPRRLADLTRSARRRLPGEADRRVYADNTALVARMEQAVAARNYHEFKSLLHAMKGSSASMETDR